MHTNEANTSDWKERLRGEYAELKERYEKLRAANTRIEVRECTAECRHTDPRKEHYRHELMKRQEQIMGEYLHLLELRMVLEEIET